MAVKSKADKTGAHKAVAVVVPGNARSTPLKKASFTTAPVAMSGILPQGAKALGLRAKAVLKPDESPDVSPE